MTRDDADNVQHPDPGSRDLPVPFPLLRYFSIASLAGLVLVVAVVSVFYRHLAVSSLKNQQTRENVLLTRAFSNSIWPSYANLMSRASRISPSDLAGSDEIRHLREAVIRQTRGLHVVKVKIYNTDGRTVFSTLADEIGVDKRDNAGVQSALAGRTASALAFRNQLDAIEQVIVDRNVLSSYVPIRRADRAPVEGVLELYRDVTDSVSDIERTQLRIVLGAVVSLLVLYLFLFLLVRRAQGVIRAQSAELDANMVRLQGAMEEAQAASSEKSRFLARMSHELRTPLTGVLGMTELLLGSRLDQRQLHFAHIIERSGKTLLRMIDDILDFSSIEAGHVAIRRSEFDLRDVVEETSTLHAEYAQEKGLELVCEVPPGLATRVRGDPVRLHQVLTNLVANAIKFTEQGEVSIRVSDQARELSSEGFLFEVCDTGIGLSPDLRQGIFETFSQGDSSSTRRYGGVGLGLAIARELVGLMEGQIGVDSEPGHGSRFWFTLPLEALVRAPAAALALPGGDQRPSALVCIMNATQRRVACTYLQEMGLAPQALDDMDEALVSLQASWARRTPPDLALVDAQARLAGGGSLVAALRAEPRLAATRLIVLRPVGDDTWYPELQSACYATRPLSWTHLRDCARRLLTGFAQDRDASLALRERHKTSRVLLAEDNAINQEVAAEMLRILGCEVDSVGDGEAVLERHGSDAYDLVIVDCQMPGLDGPEVTRRIREREVRTGCPRVPVVALSAHSLEDNRERCLAAGVDEYLAKPVTLGEIRAVLDRWLPGTGRPSPPPVTAGSARDRAPASDVDVDQRDDGGSPGIN